jgi:glutamine synthetase
MQVSMYEHDHTPFYGDPRHVLERVPGDSGRWAAARHGGRTWFYLRRSRAHAGVTRSRRDSRCLAAARTKTQINRWQELDEYSEVLSSIDEAARAQDLPTGTVLAEYGPGQFEVNLHHVDDALLACDHAIRLKRLVRGVALAHGIEATFMPKPYRDHAGSGAHLHVSLLDESGRNIFAADDPAGSPALRHAIGGLAATINDTMAVCAPTANSYRRFQPEAYVPLGPSWSVNNRGVAFRAPHGPPASRRRTPHCRRRRQPVPASPRSCCRACTWA